jgi:hypothetical protein
MKNYHWYISRESHSKQCDIRNFTEQIFLKDKKTHN